MALTFTRPEPRHLIVYSDGCPEDCLQPQGEGDERWHTISYIIPPSGNSRADELLSAFREHDPYFYLRHWHDGPQQRRASRNAKKLYREQISQFIFPHMLRTKSSAIAWSFQEKTVWASRRNLLDQFKICRHDLLTRPGKRTGTLILNSKWHSLGWLQEREFYMLLMMADSIATAHRHTIKSTNGHAFDTWDYITDNLSGDPGGNTRNNPRGMLLARLLAQCYPEVFTLRYESKAEEASPWLIVADNVAGFLNGILNGKFPRDQPLFADPGQKPLQWNWTDETFHAYQITGSLKNPPWDSTGDRKMTNCQAQGAEADARAS